MKGNNLLKAIDKAKKILISRKVKSCNNKLVLYVHYTLKDNDRVKSHAKNGVLVLLENDNEYYKMTYNHKKDKYIIKGPYKYKKVKPIKQSIEDKEFCFKISSINGYEVKIEKENNNE